jgi:hypothetical protein
MLAQGTSFTFNSTGYTVTSVRARAAQPEVVDMSPISHPINTGPMLVATGAFLVPGSVEIELIGPQSPLSMIGQTGQLSITGPVGGITENAICETAEVSAQVGDVVRGSARFLITSHSGQ